jgi:hypothetical protein
MSLTTMIILNSLLLLAAVGVLAWLMRVPFRIADQELRAHMPPSLRRSEAHSEDRRPAA